MMSVQHGKKDKSNTLPEPVFLPQKPFVPEAHTGLVLVDATMLRC